MEGSVTPDCHSRYVHRLLQQTAQQFRIAVVRADREEHERDIDGQRVRKGKSMRDVGGENAAVVADDQHKADRGRAWNEEEHNDDQLCEAQAILHARDAQSSAHFHSRGIIRKQDAHGGAHEGKRGNEDGTDPTEDGTDAGGHGGGGGRGFEIV